MIQIRKIGERLTCPCCGKEFKFTEEHKYIRHDEFVCSWKCFITGGNQNGENKESQCSDILPTSGKRKRGRPRKEKH